MRELLIKQKLGCVFVRIEDDKFMRNNEYFFDQLKINKVYIDE